MGEPVDMNSPIRRFEGIVDKSRERHKDIDARADHYARLILDEIQSDQGVEWLDVTPPPGTQPHGGKAYIDSQGWWTKDLNVKIKDLSLPLRIRVKRADTGHLAMVGAHLASYNMADDDLRREFYAVALVVIETDLREKVGYPSEG